MEIILTDTQKRATEIPTRLNLLRELNKREAFAQDEALQKEWERLERGHEGEQILLKYIKHYGEKHWIVLRNVWFQYFGRFECDLILITYAGLYLFEVKNYTGTFELKNNVGVVNGEASSKHPITQGQNLVINLNKMLRASSGKLKVTGAVTFVGVDNIVNIEDEVVDVQVIRRNELRQYLWQIAQAERTNNHHPIRPKRVLDLLGTYEIPHPFSPENAIAPEIFNNVQRGICCCSCHQFNVKITKKYVICPCGMHEPREEAIVRTICEYGVIHYKNNFTISKLNEFFDEQISRDNLRKVANKFFEKVGSYKNTEYIVKPLPFAQIYSDFGFTIPKYTYFYGPIDSL